MSKNSNPKRRPVLPADVRRDVLASNGGRCVYCGDPAECVDHITPWRICQSHERSNLVPCCQSCNSHLYDKDYGSFEHKKAHAQKRIERLKRDGFWYFHDLLSFMLRNSAIDPWEAADKCGIDRLAFEDIIGGHREASASEVKKIAWGLDYPGLPNMTNRFYCAESE